VLRAADGVANQVIARELRITRPTVLLWRQRFATAGVPGLMADASRPGRMKALSQEKIQTVVDATLHTLPPGQTHWSVRQMAAAQGISRMAVQRIWKQHHLQPHRIETFKLSRDKAFVSKLRDVVGLYLSPPDKALVLSVDEKSQIQALDRSQPGLPMKKGRCGTMTHDYKRHGTTTLFAALNMLDGKVIGECLPRHRSAEFVKFLGTIDRQTPPELDLHLILDNYATHKSPAVNAWLARHPRFHLHFIPTSSSWLNMVERWFAKITGQAIRRGVFKSVTALIEAIEEYLDAHNANPKIFTWTKDADTILAKVAKCKEAFGTLH
jgi:transposase